MLDRLPTRIMLAAAEKTPAAAEKTPAAAAETPAPAAPTPAAPAPKPALTPAFMKLKHPEAKADAVAAQPEAPYQQYLAAHKSMVSAIKA